MVEMTRNSSGVLLEVLGNAIHPHHEYPHGEAFQVPLHLLKVPPIFIISLLFICSSIVCSTVQWGYPH